MKTSKNIQRETSETEEPDFVYERWKKRTTGALIAVLVIIGVIFWIFVFDEIQFAFAFLGIGLICAAIVYALLLLFIDHCASMAKIARLLEAQNRREKKDE